MSTSLLMSTARLSDLVEARRRLVEQDAPLNMVEYSNARSTLADVLFEDSEDTDDQHELLALLQYDQMTRGMGRYHMLSIWLHPHHWPITRYPEAVLKLAYAWLC